MNLISHDSLKEASALTVKVMEIQTSVAPAEVRLRDDLQNIYALLFRFLGYSFQLAMSNVGWLATQQFVILVPDPIVFAPWPVLTKAGLATLVNKTQHHLLIKSLGCGGSDFFRTAAHWSGTRSDFFRTAAHWIGTRSECGHLSAWRRCVSSCSVSYHKSIGGRSSARWRA